MQNRLWICLFLLIVTTSFVFTLSCTKKTVEPGPSPDQILEAAKQAEKARLEALKRQQAIEEMRLRVATEEAERKKIASRKMFMDEDIYFNKGSSSLLPAPKEILKKKAKWLQGNPDVSVIIQGHSDEPGSAESNLALGESRAGNVKSFLIMLGISPFRLTAVSYGKERPIDPGLNEEARSKNRRVHFVIE